VLLLIKLSLIPMTKPFGPEKIEKMILVQVSAKEADLIKRLRKYSYGQIVVFKANGILTRIEIKDSQMLRDDGGLDLAIQ